MLICKVTGKVVSTIKNDGLAGSGIVMVRPVLNDPNGKELSEKIYAAVDPFGCNDGNLVMVTKGCNAKLACKNQNAPVDMAIVGIID